MRTFIPGVLFTLALVVAISNQATGYSPELSTPLWLISTVVLLVLLSQGYAVGRQISATPEARSEKIPRVVQLHILLHTIPLSYFPLVGMLENKAVIDGLYLLPIAFFFITGTLTWKLCHQMFGRKLYWLFRMGNLQMPFIFALMLGADLIGWPSETGGNFQQMMQGYFAVHLFLAGLIIPLMRVDIDRYGEQQGAPS